MSSVRHRPSSTRYAERWVGTLSDIADIAREVLTAFDQAGTRPQHFEIDVKTYESGRTRELVYSDVETFLRDTQHLDVACIYGVSISAFTSRGPAPIDDQRIDVHFERGPRTAVVITVSAPGDFEQFLVAAEDRINRAVEKRELPMPRTDKGVESLSYALAAGAVFVLALTESMTWTAIGLVMTVAAGVALSLKRAARWLIPTLEILPEGGMSRSRFVLGRIRWAGQGLGRPAYTALLGALFAFLLARLFD